MIRVVLFGLTGLLVGLVFGFAFFVFAGALIGGIAGLILGMSIAGYMNMNGVLKRPFYTQGDVDALMASPKITGPAELLGWPFGLQESFRDKIRTILESWL
jgi:hypothetical protein